MRFFAPVFSSATSGGSIFTALSCLLIAGCLPRQEGPSPCDCPPLNTSTTAYSGMNGALLGTRFESLEALKSVVTIEYETTTGLSDSTVAKNELVRLRHCSNGREVVAVLAQGTTQGEILKARHGGLSERLAILFNCPYAVMVRKDLGRANAVSRWRPQWFGEGDMAFFDIAKAMVGNINTPGTAFRFPNDSTEKGYLNSFNHLTSQAFITTFFSEEMADFIGDAHERDLHPELITGRFTEKQLQDLGDGPVDNYVDMINNEWGQELGSRLKEKYRIGPETVWTPEMLANYLNDLQAYYGWAFQIGFDPFRPEEEAVRRFSKKIDAILRGNSHSYD
jgi:hypothetical protein